MPNKKDPKRQSGSEFFTLSYFTKVNHFPKGPKWFSYTSLQKVVYGRGGFNKGFCKYLLRRCLFGTLGFAGVIFHSPCCGISFTRHLAAPSEELREPQVANEEAR